MNKISFFRHSGIHRNDTFRWAFKLTLAIQLMLGLAIPANAGKDPFQMAHGKYLAAMCSTCHQPDNSFEGIPPILGFSAAKMTQMMMEYKDSIEHHEVMENIAKSLSAPEIAALSIYLASLKPTKTEKTKKLEKLKKSQKNNK